MNKNKLIALFISSIVCIAVFLTGFFTYNTSKKVYFNLDNYDSVRGTIYSIDNNEDSDSVYVRFSLKNEDYYKKLNFLALWK